MTKFNVGDTIGALTDHYLDPSSASGWEGVVIETGEDGFSAITTESVVSEVGTRYDGLQYEEYNLIKPKPTKKQRISALEKKVEELQAQIDDLKQSKEVNLYSLAAEALDRQIKQDLLTNNEKRKAIIEKAKKFVEEWERLSVVKITYEINANKRTVVALRHRRDNGKVFAKGITKCAPTDVFNGYIGKAIALGRALGLDVSEFEQAVQPDEVVVGMQAIITGRVSEYTTTVRESDEGLKKNENSLGFIKANSWRLIRITNDTDAVY